MSNVKKLQLNSRIGSIQPNSRLNKSFSSSVRNADEDIYAGMPIGLLLSLTYAAFIAGPTTTTSGLRPSSYVKKYKI